MKSIDEERLETDLQYRYEYLAEFIGFDADDAAAIHASAGYVAPLIPALVEKTYEKLLGFDATARHFLPRQHGFDGDLPESLEALNSQQSQIQFRKEHLSRYLMQLIGRAYDAKMATYLDMVGKIHTPKAGNKEIDVPLVQMNALMGVISDVLTAAIFETAMQPEAALRTARAFNKLMWIQNDLVNRHYETDQRQTARRAG